MITINRGNYINQQEAPQSAVAERIKIFLKLCGVSQREFANKANINAAAFNRFVNGYTLPSFEAVSAIAKAYPTLNIRYLLVGDGEPILQENVADCQKEVVHLKETLMLKDKIIALLEAGSQRAGDGE